MARYIDADALMEMCKRQIECEWNTIAAPSNWAEAFQDFSDLVEQTPTADVAPKSEVERLEEELSKANADVKNYMKVAEYQQSLSVKRYHEIKRLKEDIERLEKTLDEYEETSGLKQAKAEFAREIFAEIQTALEYEYMSYLRAYDYTLQTRIDELKEKYTEGESNGE